MENIQVSYFKSARATDPTDISLLKFLTSEKHKAQVEALRKESDPAVRARLKKNLPAATISGTFSTRNAAGLNQYNGLVCLDFDGKDNPKYQPIDMKEILAQYKEVLYAGLSASGNGVFAIVRTNNQDVKKHGELVEYLGELCKEDNLVYDKSCKDVCRLRFISYDEAPVTNWQAHEFDAAGTLRLREIQKNKGGVSPPIRHAPRQSSAAAPMTTEQNIERYVGEIERQRADVTTSYDDWVAIGMALAAELGINGERYYHRISAFNPKYNQAETAKKYQQLAGTTSSVKIGTFFHIIRKQGIKP